MCAALTFDHVTYTYSVGTGYETKALDDVSLSIESGQFIGIIGHTGSGKSTLIQHMNGLLSPTEGCVCYNGRDICSEGFDKKELRTQVGMVFQYPEHQLFETTVFEDVKFGPKNQGLNDAEAAERANEALELVDFPEEFYEQSPFELSGGQKRRAAIAGVIAMKPVVVILDEPTAGLDPQGRKEILDMISAMHKRMGNTVILVSHSMEDVAEYADRIIVMDEGHVRFDGTPRDVFSHYIELEEMGLAAPEVTYFMHDLRDAGWDVDPLETDIDKAAAQIAAAFKRGGAR